MNKFYLLHGTKSDKTLLKILSDEYLLSGKNVDKKYRMHGGEDNELDQIFFNIYFDDIKNIDIMFPFTLIFKSEILKKHNFVFNKGWGFEVAFETFNKKDADFLFKKKIRKIRKYLKSPDIPAILLNNPGIFHHELYTETPINIKKYLIGIVCCTTNNKIKIKLDKIAKRMNILIFETNKPPPYDKLIDTE